VNPLARVAALVAGAAHAVAAEYRRLDAPPPPPPEPARTEINCTAASTQTTWQQTAPRPPASPFGFGRPPGKDSQ
jgi:hypothetical protein